MPMLNPVWEHAFIVIEGEVSLEGQSLALRDLHYLGTQRDGIILESDGGARAVLIGGAPFGESVLMWWNFAARRCLRLKYRAVRAQANKRR